MTLKIICLILGSLVGGAIGGNIALWLHKRRRDDDIF